MEIVEQYGVGGAGKMDLNKMKDLNFPLALKPQNDNEMHIRVLTNIGQKVLSLHVINTEE